MRWKWSWKMNKIFDWISFSDFLRGVCTKTTLESPRPRTPRTWPTTTTQIWTLDKPATDTHLQSWSYLQQLRIIPCRQIYCTCSPSAVLRMFEILYYMHSMYWVSLKRPCGSLKVIVQQTWLGDVRSVTPSTSETGTTGELLHRSPELSPLVYY